MNKYIPLLLVSFFLQANEVFFNEINESKNDAIEISFNLDKVAYINSYSLENPSRIVIEINDSKLTNPIEEIYNYPIKKVRASNSNGMTRIVVDLYDNVFWNKLPNCSESFYCTVVGQFAGHGQSLICSKLLLNL
ncbi:MAG: AMIN domain-containing protein [Proteobacteria bacterium]|nr:AMIN domain-containing protein [Pseudomonadota bacterium]